MVAFFEYILYRTVFNYRPCIHNSYIITGFGHYSKVMGNKYHSCFKSFFKLIHKFKNLCLNCNIKCRCRFICKKKLRLTGKCHCYNNSVFHTAGKLMRIIIFSFLRQTYQLKHFLHTCIYFFFVFVYSVIFKCFAYLHTYRKNGIKA